MAITFNDTTKNCLWCGFVMNKKEIEQRLGYKIFAKAWGRRKFCSVPCRNAFINPVKFDEAVVCQSKECLGCLRHFVRGRLPQSAWDRKKYCTLECRYRHHGELQKGEKHHNYVGRAICIDCGQQAKSYKDKRRLEQRCKPCARVYYTSERSHSWRGGKTSEHEILRNRTEYKEWRQKVFERDNFTCVQCHKPSEHDIEADHIKPICVFPELVFDMNNGRTLCRACHRKTDTWGKKTEWYNKNNHDFSI